jgi:hypothetical protein
VSTASRPAVVAMAAVLWQPADAPETSPGWQAAGLKIASARLARPVLGRLFRLVLPRGRRPDDHRDGAIRSAVLSTQFGGSCKGGRGGGGVGLSVMVHDMAGARESLPSVCSARKASMKLDGAR